MKGVEEGKNMTEIESGLLKEQGLTDEEIEKKPTYYIQKIVTNKNKK